MGSIVGTLPLPDSLRNNRRFQSVLKFVEVNVLFVSASKFLSDFLHLNLKRQRSKASVGHTYLHNYPGAWLSHN